MFAGVSGSGMSSFAFGTIAFESARQWQNNYSLYIRNKMPHYERLGFTQLGTIPRGFRMKDGTFAAICPYFKEIDR